jgi:hypothetical protein
LCNAITVAGITTTPQPATRAPSAPLRLLCRPLASSPRPSAAAKSQCGRAWRNGLIRPTKRAASANVASSIAGPPVGSIVRVRASLKSYCGAMPALCTARADDVKHRCTFPRPSALKPSIRQGAQVATVPDYVPSASRGPRRTNSGALRNYEQGRAIGFEILARAIFVPPTRPNFRMYLTLVLSPCASEAVEAGVSCQGISMAMTPW